MHRHINTTSGAFIAAAVLAASAAHASRGYSVLYNFCTGGQCTDGTNPQAGLIADSSGNLYGTTEFGGSGSDCPYGGCGTIFAVSPKGKEKVLYSFCEQANCTDGLEPLSALASDKSGNLYGTTLKGGKNNAGTVFELTATGAQSVLYSFCSRNACIDGASPMAGVTIASDGTLYGTTAKGGNNPNYGCGVVFALSRKGKETVLHTFGGNSNDGCSPQAALLRDSGGNLFGTTESTAGGASGTVYELSATGSYNVLYLFCSQFDCTDGSGPMAPVVEDKAGNLYGTTYGGGQEDKGVVFELATNGTETVLYSFCQQANCADGLYPSSGLLMIHDGKHFFGTTEAGGGFNGGEVFELSGGVLNVLHSFGSGSDGMQVTAPVVLSNRWLYGATAGGGTGFAGTVFRLGTKGDGLR
ncbi:MAG: choice-of-anchor tandem repeat GloVer-containing protein [Rhizomicrobium sp.]